MSTRVRALTVGQFREIDDSVRVYGDRPWKPGPILFAWWSTLVKLGFAEVPDPGYLQLTQKALDLVKHVEANKLYGVTDEETEKRLRAAMTAEELTLHCQYLRRVRALELELSATREKHRKLRASVRNRHMRKLLTIEVPE
jgi:hypothetical protein